MNTLNDSGYHRMRHGNTSMTVAPGWAQSLQTAQCRALCEQLFSKGEMLKQGVYKTIVRAQAQGRDLLVKRYASGGLARRLKYALGSTRARQEFQAAAHILAAGIPTPEPLLLAERRSFGWLPAESMVAIEFVPGCRELRDVFFDKEMCTPEERLQIAARFGELTARIFRAGIFQQDYSLNNFLIHTTDSGHELLFIDFERVSITHPLGIDQRLRLLAKLNRVGREVSDVERLRFIASFLEAGGAHTMQADTLSRKVQDLTIDQIARDIARGRITSLHTHGRYERISRDKASGLRRSDIAPEAIPAILRDAAGNDAVNVPCGSGHARLRVLNLPGEGAEKFWACLNALIIAGLDAELPHVLLTRAPQGFVLYENKALDRCRTALASDTPNTRFLRSRLPEAFAFVRQHMAQAHDRR